MKVTFLGTGTSHGVPVIGCRCTVCTSDNPKNKRTRCSIWVQADDVSLIVDTATEFRLQAIRHGVHRIDALLFTHGHADHIMGLDDIRPFNEAQDGEIPCYGHEHTIEVLQSQFAYAFKETGPGGGKPRITLHPVHGRFTVGRLKIEAVEVVHGLQPVYGYRFGRFAYVTDASYIPKSSREKLKGLDVLVLNALRFRPHETHLSISEALKIIEELKPGRVFLTHICHELDHEGTNRVLPDGVELAYDGLEIEIPSQ